MLFAIHCVDKPGHAHLRAANRADHLAYLDGFVSRIVLAGPTLTDDGQGMTGSVLIVDFPDRKAAEAFAAGDPYRKAGLFESATVKPFRQVYPKS
jgi:uncharacterized protein YciI